MSRQSTSAEDGLAIYLWLCKQVKNSKGRGGVSRTTEKLEHLWTLVICRLSLLFCPLACLPGGSVVYIDRFSFLLCHGMTVDGH